MAVLDRAVLQVLYVKYRLGLFDNPYVDEQEASRVVHNDKHQETALQAALEGIVLLKNEGDLLPLNKDIKSIAVIGPNANDEMNQLGDYTTNKVLQEVATVLEGIRNKVSLQVSRLRISSLIRFFNCLFSYLLTMALSFQSISIIYYRS